jgi:tetratricopeptide (TPR) repeat protein
MEAAMSTTLQLADRLLSLGQRYLRLGRDQEALKAFVKLTRLPEVDREIAEEAQAGLADIYFRRNKFKQARRHLHIALTRDPRCARYHHLLAVTLEEEDPVRAAKHYARAVKLAPNVAEYRCDYGLCLFAMAEAPEGLKQLAKAVELDPDCVDYVRHHAMSLIEADKPDLARRTVLAALFRNPREPRLKGLWQELRFREAQQTQQRVRLARRFDGDAPMLLPFRPVPEAAGRQAVREAAAIVRMDGPGHGLRAHLGGSVRRGQHS